jgi:hypothetical protein
MMRWVRHHDRVDFAARVTPFLLRNEAANNLQLGIIGRLLSGKPMPRVNANASPLLMSCESGESAQGSPVVAVAIQTPPFSIILTEAPEGAAATLVTHLAATDRHNGRRRRPDGTRAPVRGALERANGRPMPFSSSGPRVRAEERGATA